MAKRKGSRRLIETEEMAEDLIGKRNKQIAAAGQSEPVAVKVGMPNACIKVTIENKQPDAFGKDSIEFLFDNLPGGWRARK